MTLANCPFDGVTRLEDIQHVNAGVEYTLKIECVLDDALRVRGKIGRDKNLRHFLKADFFGSRLIRRDGHDRPVRHPDDLVRHDTFCRSHHDEIHELAFG